MSISVDPEQLAESVAGQGATVYLLTSDDDGRPRVNQVLPTVTKNRVAVTAGGSAARNVATRPLVSLLWPPAADGGFTLLADGVAEVGDEDSGVSIEIVVTSAVLHRRSAEPT